MKVDCEWCAYCFDEALLVREAAKVRKDSEPEEESDEAVHERVLARMRADGAI